MKNTIRQIGVLLFATVCVCAAQVAQLNTAPKPAPAPARWLGLIGEYGPDSDILYILEKDGKLSASFKRAEAEPLQEISRNVFEFAVSSVRPMPHEHLVFVREHARAIQVKIDSKRNCLISEPRFVPSTFLIPTSRARLAERAVERFIKFTQAISSTINATAAKT